MHHHSRGLVYYDYITVLVNYTQGNILGINLVFTESDYGFGDVSTNLKNLALAGADEYDIISNDIYQLAILASDGYLRNVYNSTVLDLTKEYWYGDAMRDLQFIEGGMYLLVGDYFTDSLASAHALFANESIINDNFGSTEYINEMVFDGKWTIDDRQYGDHL